MKIRFVDLAHTFDFSNRLSEWKIFKCKLSKDFHLTRILVVFQMDHETEVREWEQSSHIVVFMSNKFKFRQFHCHFLFHNIEEKVLSISLYDILYVYCRLLQSDERMKRNCSPKFIAEHQWKVGWKTMKMEYYYQTFHHLTI